MHTARPLRPSVWRTALASGRPDWRRPRCNALPAQRRTPQDWPASPCGPRAKGQPRTGCCHSAVAEVRAPGPWRSAPGPTRSKAGGTFSTVLPTRPGGSACCSGTRGPMRTQSARPSAFRRYGRTTRTRAHPRWSAPLPRRAGAATPRVGAEARGRTARSAAATIALRSVRRRSRCAAPRWLPQPWTPPRARPAAVFTVNCAAARRMTSTQPNGSRSVAG